jgi:hypothetical protein
MVSFLQIYSFSGAQKLLVFRVIREQDCPKKDVPNFGSAGLTCNVYVLEQNTNLPAYFPFTQSIDKEVIHTLLRNENLRIG